MGFLSGCLLLGLLPVIIVAQENPMTNGIDTTNIKEEMLSYELLGDSFDSILIWDASFDGPRPVVLLVPDSNGKIDFEKSVAQRLANLGYAAVVVGLFSSTAEVGAIQAAEILTLRNSPDVWLQRIEAAMISTREQDPDVVDPNLMAVIGYGFGGDSVLEMVRAGSNVSGVIAIHPITLEPAAPESRSFNGRVLVLLGDLQANVSSADVFQFQDELRSLVADWEVTRFSKAKGGFSRPTDNNFDVIAEMRTWHSVTEFLEQVFDPSMVEYIEEPFNVTGVDQSVLVSRTIEYSEGDAALEGFVSYSNTSAGKRGVIIIIPDWDGIGDYERWRANLVAMKGYVGFVADIYGKNVMQGPSLPIEERRELTTSFLNPPTAIRSRIAAALNALKINELSEIADTSKVVAIGYCFGGTGVLEFMRDEPEGLLGVVGFHASMPNAIGAKAQECNNVAALVLNGADDPGVLREEIEDFMSEMNAARANWEFTDYGNTVHAFTEPTLPREGDRAAYNPIADLRSWESMKAFVEVLFSQEVLYNACSGEAR